MKELAWTLTEYQCGENTGRISKNDYIKDVRKWCVEAYEFRNDADSSSGI